MRRRILVPMFLLGIVASTASGQFHVSAPARADGARPVSRTVATPAASGSLTDTAVADANAFLVTTRSTATSCTPTAHDPATYSCP